MVDDVCLYFSKCEISKSTPIRSVPLFQESDDAKYKNYISVRIPNEKDIQSGKFGWCIICRNTAPFFCKDTRVPICSVDCKKKHFEESQNAQLVCLLYQKGHVHNPILEDSNLVFHWLCRSSMDDK
jgi:brefeldin A-inhibited guanine nucleotide-exchange protein